MTRIIIDAPFLSQLQQATQPVELCDPSGRVLGQFVPAPLSSAWEFLTPDISEEELDRRTRSTEKRYTTAEVLKHLEAM